MKRSLLMPTLSVIVLIGSVLACGSDTSGTDATSPPPTATPVPTAGIEIRAAVLAHDIDDEHKPVNPDTEFAPNEKIWLSITLKGRPKEGTVTVQFFLHDEMIVETEADLADVNSGIIFSVGEDTYLDVWLTGDDTLPISGAYRADVSFDGEYIDSYTFAVVPPPDAIPSVVREATLARGVDDDYNPVEPTTTFGPDEKVYLVGRGDLGIYTWVRVEWYVDGVLDEEGTKQITWSEDAADSGFFFSYLPEAGWPEGEHQVVLIMNDEEVGRYDFAIQESTLVPYEDPEGVFRISYPPDFDDIEKDLEDISYTTNFDAPGDSNLIYVYFGNLGKPVTDEQWEGFVQNYTVAGMPGFGQDTIELDRQSGKPGTHILYLEVESEETNTHGLVWVEEIDGILNVTVLVVSLDDWPAREAEIRATVDSFVWSADAAHALLD
jgi:hypothetical protein